MSEAKETKKPQERPIGGGGKFIFCGKSHTGFVGLFNQGATCYLNSMLQALYMTPQFRASIFEFRYDKERDGDPKFCIPYQLQLLFARLAKSKQPAVNTKGLTISFHWDRAQSFQQNDVQELMKVLFDALEKTLHVDPNNSFTNTLYMGTSIDSLKALTDGYERRIDSKFDQLQLALSEDVDSVEKGIEKFLAPEKLIEGNRWRHPKTKEKVDAEKRIILAKLPTVLTIALSRFKMNWQLMQRVKVNQKVTVAETIDMNKYVEETKEGGLPYDLFAIMMHSGTARGGHYYSYIKSFKDNKWYRFNDAVVSPLEAKEGEDVLALAHGNGKGTSAYLLMYIDRSKIPKDDATDKMIPDELLKVVQAEDEEWEKERAEYERLRRLICMTVYYDNTEIKQDMDKGVTVAEVLSAVLKKAAIDSKFEPQDTRLRRYDPAMGWAQDDLDPKATLEELKFHRNMSLILETRNKGEDWPVINPNAVPLRTIFATEENIPLILQQLHYSDTKGLKVSTLMVDKTAAFDEVCKEIEKVLKVENGGRSSVRLIKLDTTKSEIINDSAKTLKDRGTEPSIQTLNVPPGCLLYAERIVEGEPSKLIQEYDKTVGQISVEFNLVKKTEKEGEDDNSNPIVTVSKNKTLKQLKQAMLPILGLEHVDDFRLKRNAKAEQFKDEDQTLEDLKFMSSQYVYVEKGRPLRKGESNLKFYYYDPDVDGKMAYLFKVPVLETQKVQDLFQDLLRYLNDAKPNGKGGNKYELKHMRIREKLKGGPGAIFQSTCALNRGLKSFRKFRDGDSLVIQKIPKPEVFDKKKNQMVFVHQFERDHDRLHRRREIIVSRLTKVEEIVPELMAIAKDMNDCQVEEKNIGVGVGKLTSATTVADCINIKWKSLKDLDSSLRLQQALGVRSEGTLIFCDLATSVKSKPSEKKSTAKGRARFKRPQRGGKRATENGIAISVASRPRPAAPEKALKIWTNADKAAEAKKKREEENQKKEAQKTSSDATTGPTAVEEDQAYKEKLAQLSKDAEKSGGKKGGIKLEF